MSQKLKGFAVSVSDAFNRPLGPSAVTSMTVYNAGTKTAATVYLDELGDTSLTLPVSAPPNSQIRFYGANYTYDLMVIVDGQSYTRTITASTSQIHLVEQDLDKGVVSFDTSKAVSAALVDTAGSFTFYDKTIILDGRLLVVGDRINIKAVVRVGDVNGTPTLDTNVTIGTEVIYATGDISITDDSAPDYIDIDIDLLVTAIGASATVQGRATLSTKLNATHAQIIADIAEATEDLSGAAIIKVGGDWSAAHAENLSYLDELSVKVIRAAA